MNTNVLPVDRVVPGVGWAALRVWGVFFFAVTACGSVRAADEPELGLGGYCPVSYHTDNKPVKGDANIKYEYRGYEYHFVDGEKRKQFTLTPEKYLPQIGGLCTVALGGPYGNRFAGDPTVFAVVDGKLYLMSSERAKKSFDPKPAHYIQRAEELFSKPELGGFCPVSFQTASMPKHGSPEFKQVYRGKLYHLSDSGAQTAFLEAPEVFVPRYDGACAEGISRGKRFAGDPNVFAIIEGRLYLFFDPEARARFTSDSAKSIVASDANWPEVKKLKKP
ncbi:MAG: YHS domain-containing (seleno)protein [Planctomycetota bacterium]